MSVIRRAIIICLLTAVSGIKAEINFTPTVNRYFSEGAEYSSVTFKENKRSISMEVPRLWTCHGDASRLQFTPPDQHFAEGTIQAAPASGVVPFNEATIKALEGQLMNSLPPGSQAITMVSRQENPIILEQNLSYEFVVSYQTLGKVFLRSVIFVNCPDKQLIFRFTAPKENFDALNKAFRHSLYSWHGATAPAPPAPSSTN